MLLQIKPVTLKTFNFKFENISFTKLQKKILMIRHVTNKVIITLKFKKCKNFFKLLIKGNIKYVKFNQFLSYFTYNKNEIKGSPKIRMKAKRTSQK